MIDGLRIEFASDTEHEFLVADVYYNSSYMFMLYAKYIGRKLEVTARFFKDDQIRDPFKGDIEVNTLIDMINEARQLYIDRLEKGPNPFP